MGLDKANIFKLDDEEQAKYKRDPFLDCFESTKTFAKALMRDIETKETPHSLLLSADYGMGKTFFATRFTQYLRKNHYDVIYFSVWENDYMNEPFLAFSKVIVNYINSKFQYEKYKDSMKFLFEGIEKVVSSISLSFLGGTISIASKELLDNFKDIDPIINFRKQLTSFITKIPKKKLVIIVDELDRCRPDYAMKTLECIKHFFDIEGLFIIIPTNINALNDCIKSLYGIEEETRTNCEKYSQKFFNDERTIKKPTQEDYLYIVNQYLTKLRLKDAFDKKLLSEHQERYDSYENLKNFFAQYSHSAGLTVRELKDFSIELARICNNFYEPIRVQWLACIMAYKYTAKNFDFRYPLTTEHCFYKEHYTSQRRENKKDKILSMSKYFEELNRLKSISYPRDKQNHIVNSEKYYNFTNKYCNVLDSIQKYSDIYEFLNKLMQDIMIIKRHYNECPDILNNLNIIEQLAISQIKITKQYQFKFGSDDNDNKREKIYQNIIDNPEVLYTITIE